MQTSSETEVRSRTAESFAYEWEAFGDIRPEWSKNFFDYMQPHRPEFFDGISVLDVGTGSGRHARIAADLGARVVAVDLGDSIDVARRNVPPDVITVQADAEALPLSPESFDFVMSIGVLHHLPDTERALRGLVRYVRPGGRLHVYLYWEPPRQGHRLILRGVTLARRLTTRLPHRLLHIASYPLAAVLFATIVLPYRVMRRFPRLKPIADALPLKAYADYPFGVLVNDQFDRFSAPIERRFTRDEAEQMMRDAGLVDVVVLPNNGWVCDGRRP
jgi:ubiquinone/menaquinone biosynthesis C-methylase UbiE